ncbi:MAG: dephospho-CoA kinase [Propionibacteriaceae bacterium]|nr:dephospho-CoA kinase [Propionibacteriaceae bacterium]
MRVALTGGIACGKSMVAQFLREAGAVIIDADELAREVVAVGTEGLAAVVDQFGADYVRCDGSLDRAKLGEAVFNDPQAREHLEAILHPRIRALAAEYEAQAPTEVVVVQVIPLLVETGQADTFDVVIVVDLEPEVQLERLMARNGLDLEQAQQRIAAQASRAGRLAVADFVISNDSDLKALRRKTRQVYYAIRASMSS